MSKKEIIIKGGTKKLTFHKAQFPELERVEKNNMPEEVEEMSLQDFIIALSDAGKKEHAEKERRLTSGHRAPEAP